MKQKHEINVSKININGWINSHENRNNSINENKDIIDSIKKVMNENNGNCNNKNEDNYRNNLKDQSNQG